ncbi:MAG TPA: FAD-binding oxidoreductase [Candidatus Paceibacterota bacterium]|nr:FAD-binding oxidoreductase [Candidatus Paceibacterota bacterium]
MMNVENLKKVILGDVVTNEDDIAAHSRDASIFQVRPEVVVYPKDSADIQHLVRWAKAEKAADPSISITARSAGTDMSGGPLNESIIVDCTRYLNHIKEVGDGFAVAEPGVYYRDFEKETLKKGLLLPSYPASRSIAALGGIVSNNSGGEKSLAYGKTERYVRELNVVLSDGNEYAFGPLTLAGLEEKKTKQNFEGQIYRAMYELIESNYDLIQRSKPDVSKNSAGYYLWNVWDRKNFDLTKLFVGSQGTLGVVTKMKLGLVRPKPFSKLLILFLRDLAPLGEIVNAIGAYKPESMESFDDHTMTIALQFLPQLLKQMKGNIFSLAWKFLPEAFMALTGGMPKLILITEFTGDSEAEIADVAHRCEAEIRRRFNLKTHIARDADEAEKYWVVRRESFNLLRKHSGNKHTAPFIDDIIVHPNQLSQFIPELNNLIARYKGLTYTIAGHAGDANFHIIPLMDFHDPANRAAIPELSEKVYKLVASLHGSITAEHNDGLIRTPYLPVMYSPEMIALFERTKEIFDPLNLFNPGKKVHGSKEYMMSHIVKE